MGGGEVNAPLEFGDSCPCPKPLIFLPLPGKHPNLFHFSLTLAREIPPSRDMKRSEQAGYLLRDSANLTFKTARAGLRPAPARVPAHSFPAGPHHTTGAALQVLLPSAMSAALTVPNPLLFSNLKSNLNRIFRHSFSHLHRTFLIKIKQSSVSRIFKGLSSKLLERKSIPPTTTIPPSHPQPGHRSATVSEARRRRLSVPIPDRRTPHRARPPLRCGYREKAPHPSVDAMAWGTPPPLRHNPAAADEK